MFRTVIAADYEQRLVARTYGTLAAYQQATGQDRNSVTVSLDDFVKVTPVNPKDPRILYLPEKFDFRLKRTSRAVDAGTPLPGINDGFSGRAPDLGAIEFNAPIPQYGPRTWPVGTSPSQARTDVGPPRR